MKNTHSTCYDAKSKTQGEWLIKYLVIFVQIYLGFHGVFFS